MTEEKINWTQHERDCLMEWEHLWMFDVRPGPEDMPKVTATADIAIPEAVAQISELVMNDGADYFNANAHGCPEHGAWVAVFIGLTVNGDKKILHFAFDLKATKDEALTEFKKSAVNFAGELAADTIGKLLKNQPHGLVELMGGRRSLDNRVQNMRRKAEREARRKLGLDD